MTWLQNAPTRAWDKNPTRWMSQLDDNLGIQDLTIPGTHDSAALLGFTHFNVSVTQDLKIEDQLAKGIRFLDLRVKIMFGDRGLAMYHGADAIYDPDKPDSLDQYYYKSVIEKCYRFLNANPGEGLIISLKCEGDTSYESRTVEDWWRKIANDVAWDFKPGTWADKWDIRSNMNATLGDIRGKMLLWRRFPHEGYDAGVDYQAPFALDLTPLNSKYDNTLGASWYTDTGGYTYAQDHYGDANLGTKLGAWLDTANKAYGSRLPGANDFNRQYLNFSSVGAGSNPDTYANKINPLLEKWLNVIHDARVGQAWNAPRARSGIGVIPMDFPSDTLIDQLIEMNFGWSYKIDQTSGGQDFERSLVLMAGAL